METLPKSFNIVSSDGLGIQFSFEDAQLIEEIIFPFLDKLGYRWRNGDRPNDWNFWLGSSFISVNYDGYDEEKELTHGSSFGASEGPIYTPEEFIIKYINKMDTSSIFDMINESDEMEDLPKSFDITIGGIARKTTENIDMIEKVIFPFLNDLGYRWRGGQDLFSGYDLRSVYVLNINYGNREPKILSHGGIDRKSTRLNSSHVKRSRMPSSA